MGDGGAGIGRCPLVLLSVPLPSGGNASNIPRASHWGDYFVYSDITNDWKIFSTRILLGVSHTATDQTVDDIIGFEKTSVCIGSLSGLLNQDTLAIAVGSASGNINQYTAAIALGTNAGSANQKGVAIGLNSGQINQGTDSVAIGSYSGQNSQQTSAIAIGFNAGQISQQLAAIAIGENAGRNNQKANAVAIGTNVGQTNQATYSIMLGQNIQSSNYQCVAINATTNNLVATNNGLFVSPIRGPRIATNLLSWDTGTNEIFYNGSSQRYKYDIQDYVSSESVCNLEPREFKYKINGESDIGMIAEEVFQQNKGFAYLDESKEPEGIQWNAITVSLVQEMKRLKQRIQQIKEYRKRQNIING
jgi:hypothetical protein